MIKMIAMMIAMIKSLTQNNFMVMMQCLMLLMITILIMMMLMIAMFRNLILKEFMVMLQELRLFMTITVVVIMMSLMPESFMMSL